LGKRYELLIKTEKRQMEAGATCFPRACDLETRFLAAKAETNYLSIIKSLGRTPLLKILIFS
jgi:hypothetical protein